MWRVKEKKKRRKRNRSKSHQSSKTYSDIRDSRPQFLIESGTEEYRGKKEIHIEGIGSSGAFKRARVLDQTKFDELFLNDNISKEQYAAADMYLGLMSISGCFIKSPNLGAQGSRSNPRDTAGAMASKIIAISSARSRLRDAGEHCLVAVEACVGMNADVNLPDLRSGLNALVRYFHI
jgi:hypothetical protein